MASLPQLVEEDLENISQVLRGFLEKSEADAALVTAEGGFVIFQEGKTRPFDVATLGALASNAFNASQAIAGLIDEPNFNCLYQQGEKFSLLVSNIDCYHALVVVFPSPVAVGAVKYFAGFAVEQIARQLRKARERAPDRLLDAAMLNLGDTSEFFKKKN